MADTKKTLEKEFNKKPIGLANPNAKMATAETTDYTNQPQATTQEDVNNQDARTRLWQSLGYSYGRQREQSDKAYDQAYSQADRQALSRGMQRSSYNAQTLANINQQKIDAQNNIYANQIADYQNRLTELEQREQEADRWERQFAENQRQFDENLGFQKSESERSQVNWEKEFAAGREDTAWNQQWQKEQAAQAQSNWEKEYAAGREDAAWNKEWQQKEADREQQNWQSQFDFSKEQWQAQQDQWKQEFDYNKMSDDQKLAYNYVVSILGQGGDPSDDLLARAGLSRADANAMKTQAATSGGRSGNNPKPKTDNTPSTGKSINDGMFEDNFSSDKEFKTLIDSFGSDRIKKVKE